MTHVELKGNAEYAAQVIEVKHLVEYETLDNLVGLPVNGMTALVSKATKVGDLLLAIPAGAQLSEAFARSHNLMRDQGGYLEDNRRVRAIRLRGIPSNMLTVKAPEGVAVGTLFDHLDGEAICWKYEVPTKPGASRSAQAQAKAWKRVDAKFLPEHLDTSNWYRNVDSVPEDSIFTVSQKIHGTSLRFANTIVKRKHNWIERLAIKVGLPVPETEYAFVAGSRRVIKDPESGTQNHWYESDIWTREGLKFKDSIPRGFVVYGELVGWIAAGQPIQKNYTYALPEGQSEFYVYRVATITPDGILTDLSWPAVKAFCRDRGMKHVPEFFTSADKAEVEFVAGAIRDSIGRKFSEDDQDQWADTPLRLDAKSPCDEGLVIRVDNHRNMLPEFYKSKSAQFLEHESSLLDNDEEVLS